MANFNEDRAFNGLQRRGMSRNSVGVLEIDLESNPLGIRQLGKLDFLKSKGHIIKTTQPKLNKLTSRFRYNGKPFTALDWQRKTSEITF